MTYTQPFEKVWKELPKQMKKGKWQSQKTWTKLNDAGQLPDYDDIIRALCNQKKERVFLRKQKRFVPEWKHFSTWLNAGCTDDDCELPSAKPLSPPVNGMDNMRAAFAILKEFGEQKFNEFCETRKMSDNDRKAVFDTFNMSIDVKGLTSGMLKKA